MSKSRRPTSQVVPLYHPTSILLVDEDDEFLRSMKLVLQRGFDCFAFHRADEAIQFIRSEPVLLNDAQYATPAETEAAMEHINDPYQRRLHIEVSRLPRVFADRSRFIRTSVVVTDSTTPGMPVLELLETLRDVPLRKLLLSELMHEQIAEHAFRSGLIDAFYPKDHPSLPHILADHLRELQFEFFRQLTQPFEPALMNGDARFLCDPAFGQTFDRFVAERRIIEHCVLMQPPGILGLDERGNSVILLVADNDYRQASFEIARAEGAPAALLRCLLHGQALAAFPTQTGFYSHEWDTTWSQYIWPSETFGDEDWRYAVIDEPEVVRRVCGQVVSYADHRRCGVN